MNLRDFNRSGKSVNSPDWFISSAREINAVKCSAVLSFPSQIDLSGVLISVTLFMLQGPKQDVIFNST